MTFGLHWIGLFPRKAMGRSVALTVASAPIWVRLSLFPLFFLWGDVALLEEYKGRVERAIQLLSRMSSPNLRQTMKLNAALGVAILNTNGSFGRPGPASRCRVFLFFCAFCIGHC
jgi:hypothetical protein